MPFRLLPEGWGCWELQFRTLDEKEMGEGGKLSQCVHKTVQYGSVWAFEGFLGDLMLFQDILIPSRAIIMAFFKMAFSK